MPPRLQLTNSQIEKMKDEFLKLDVDGNGTITIDELADVLRGLRPHLNVSEEDIVRTLKDIDRDGDGTVDVEEYIKSRKYKTNMDLLHRALVLRSQIRKEFEDYDQDHSGYITKDELVSVIENRVGITFTKEQTEKIVGDIDSDDDGKLNYEEFVFLMTR